MPYSMRLRPHLFALPPRLLAAVAVAGLLLSGCANRDFDEVSPMLVRADIHDWLGPKAIGGPGSNFDLTEDERLLRDLAYPLIEPPYDRQRWYSVLSEHGVLNVDQRGGFDQTRYVERLLTDEPHRSSSGRYAKLLEDIRNDSERLPQFFATAWRVVDMDGKRRKALDFIAASETERAEALRRIHENATIVSWVETSLRERASAYRFALERLAVMSPSPTAVEVERLLTQLQARTAQRPGFVPQRLHGYVRNSL